MKCTDDPANKKLTLYFNVGSYALSGTSNILYIHITTSSDDDITKDGVQYLGTDSNFLNQLIWIIFKK